MLCNALEQYCGTESKIPLCLEPVRKVTLMTFRATQHRVCYKDHKNITEFKLDKINNL